MTIKFERVSYDCQNAKERDRGGSRKIVWGGREYEQVRVAERERARDRSVRVIGTTTIWIFPSKGHVMSLALVSPTITPCPQALIKHWLYFSVA